MKRGARANINPARRAAIGQALRERTRERLLDAGQRILSEQGPERPVIEDFIQAAGVSRGTFYNYFKTKEDLIAALFARLRGQQRVDIERIARLIPDPAERLAAHVRIHMQRKRQSSRSFNPPADLFTEAVRASTRQGPREDIRLMIEAGRIPLTDLDFATEVALGLIGNGMRMVVRGETAGKLDVQLATALLCALGMAFGEAAEIAGRPLPPDVPGAQSGTGESG